MIVARSLAELGVFADILLQVCCGVCHAPRCEGLS